MFYVGQKVVCIDDIRHKNYLPKGCNGSWPSLSWPQKNYVYTIKDINRIMGVKTLILSEISNGCYFSHGIFGPESGYAAARFRPVVERKTDISIFEAMLHNAPSKVDA